MTCRRSSRSTTRSRPGALQLHDGIPGNVAFDFEYGDEAKVQAAFAQAAHVTRLTLESQRLVGNPMEPKACLAAYDASTETFDLYAPSQGMTLMLGGLSAILGHPAEKIRLHARDVGGGFGVRSDAYSEYCAADARGEDARQAGEMDRHARRDLRQRLSRTRGAARSASSRSTATARSSRSACSGSSTPGPTSRTPARSSTRCCRASTPPTCTGFRRSTVATGWC